MIFGRRLLGGFALAIFFFSRQLPAQPSIASNVWQRVEQLPQNQAGAIWIQPQKFHAFSLNHQALRQVLDTAPRQSTISVRSSGAQIALPMPDGTLARFQFVESSVMAPELAAKFPSIRTFLGQGIDDPRATVHFDITPVGFHAQVLSPHGAVYIDPLFRGDPNLHCAYYKRDYRKAAREFQCLSPSGAPVSLPSQPLLANGGALRTFRLACAATAEFTAYWGGTTSDGMSGIVAAINRVSGVYESELSIQLQLVANNNLLVYTNPATEPYSNYNINAILSQNQANLDAVIGSTNYDIGHVFGTSGGGLALIGVVCVSGSKAHGATGLPDPVGDPFYIDYVAHEMGHEFGAHHPFNGTNGFCGSPNQRYGPTAYEPGSGSTIMAYAGICDGDNLQSDSDPYFHSVSLDEILTYIGSGSGSGCAVSLPNGDNPPSVNAGPNYAIPQGTPFTLVASGSTLGSNILTYCWEERDLGPASSLSVPDNGFSPLFRSFLPTTNASRTFPRWSDILNNTMTPGEMLPATNRVMDFRVTARDNAAGGGGVNSSETLITVVATNGPFQVIAPAPGAGWSNLQTVAWNVAGTAAAPINASNVNILLSTNSGFSFDTVLASNVPNSGSQIVSLPNISNSTARIMVAAAGNIFFDVSHGDFSILNYVPTPQLILDSVQLLAENCLGANGAIDPGETVTLKFGLRNIGSADTTNLLVTLLATNGIVVPSGPQSYGVLPAGGASGFGIFTFTAVGSCGGTIGPLFQLQDGAANLGTASGTLPLGVLTTVLNLYTNAVPMPVPGSGLKGPASPYPSTITVSGATGSVSQVRLTLWGLSHTSTSNLDILLVGPSGTNVIVMSDTGGGGGVTNVNLTFDDNATSFLPDTGQVLSGTYKPTNIDTNTDGFLAPAPPGPFGATLSVFNGSNPNGAWSLFIVDDAAPDSGTLAGGWSLSLLTSNTVCCTMPALQADLALTDAPSASLLKVGDNLAYTLAITNLGPNTASNVVLTDTLPPGITFVSASASQGVCTNNGGVVTGTLGNVPSGTVATATIVVTANNPGTITNVASVSSDTFDPNSANNTFSVTTTVNSPLTISAIPDQTINQDTNTGPIPFVIGDLETAATNLIVSATSSNTTLVPVTNIVFSGVDTNRTVTITPATNQFGTSLITISVSDGQTSASSAFLLTVNHVNHPPVLAPVADRTVHAGSLLTITNSASDPLDNPPNSLTFSLDPGAPPLAAINPTNGLFAWPTAASGVNTTNPITVRVTDDGTPPLSAAQSFTVTVVAPPSFQTIALSNEIVNMTWSAISGQVYRLQFKTNLTDSNWTDLPPDVNSPGSVAGSSDAFDSTSQRFYRLLVP